MMVVYGVEKTPEVGALVPWLVVDVSFGGANGDDQVNRGDQGRTDVVGRIKVGAGEVFGIQILKGDSEEVGILKIGTAQVGAGEAGKGEVSALQISMDKGGVGEIGVAEVGIS